jgi:hypothetical protein
MGPTYYMRLKHMVKDKINYRTTGPRTKLTRQTVGGRANDGGLRVGEMERDAIISHGAVNMLTESMMERGDKYYMAVCNKTGMIAIYHPEKNLFFSPMSDGPIQFIGSLNNPEQQMHIKNVSKYGRSFSIVCVPYTLKLLLQELQCMNVSLRIITEDNIDQMENMKFSRNVERLIQRPVANMNEIIAMNKRALNMRDGKKDVLERSPLDIPDIPSPLYAPIESPQYVPDSASIPSRTPGSQSPPYASESPPYVPDSASIPSRTPGSQSPPYATDSPISENEKIGGQINIEGEETEFQKGEFVIFQGGKPSDIWRVKDVGNGFVTIENSNTQSNNDNIRIVNPIDLHKFTPDQSFQSVPQYTQPTMYQPPAVNFSPTIVVGDNNKMGYDQSNPNPNPNPNYNSNDSSVGNFVMKKTEEPNLEKINVDSNNENKETKETKEIKDTKESGGGFLNFFNIRKLE